MRIMRTNIITMGKYIGKYVNVKRTINTLTGYIEQNDGISHK